MIINKAGEIIPHEVAKKLVDNYKAKKKPRLDDTAGTKKKETTSVWFDYAFCEMLMKDLKRGEINGLRIYFGAYDETHSKEENKNKMTVVLVTTTGSREAQRDEDDIQGDDDLTPSAGEKDLLYEYNEGKLCPPKCQGTRI